MSDKVQKLDPQTQVQAFELQLDIALKYGLNIPARTIQVVGEIDQNMFILIDTALTILEGQSKATVTIKINSEGGSVYDALAIVGRLKSSKCKIITEGYGAIMSAAGLILAAGDKRRMSKYGWFMFHEAAIPEMGHNTVAQLEHYSKQLRREWDEWTSTMAKFSTAPQAFWDSKGNLGRDLYLTAQECEDLGVIDEVF